MKRLIALVLLVIFALPCTAKRKPHVSFEATIARIEPWGPIRMECGAYANYRFAEYEVGVVYDGQFVKGQKVVVEHLACNYNELDDLRVGDKVLLVAEVLDKPDVATWDHQPKDTGERISIAYRGLAVGKLVYPTADSPR